MKNFDEIAQKCINKQISGTFIVKDLVFNKIYYVTSVRPSPKYSFQLVFPDNTFIEFNNNLSSFHMFRILNFIPSHIIIR